MAIPFPGQPVRGSTTGKPLMALIDLLGRTWAMGVVWQLSMQPRTFRNLQLACDGISPTLLNTRLKELKALYLVESGEQGYCLTPKGHELFELIAPLGPWSLTWHQYIKEQSDDA